MSLTSPADGARLAASAARERSQAEQMERAELREACRMFEAQFLKLLWKEMRETVPEGGLVHGGMGEDIFTDYLDQARADQAVAGGSMGLAQLLERQLSGEGSARPGAKIGEPLDGSAGAALSPPVPGATLTSGFGQRVHPITGEHRQHQGLDWAAPEGAPVSAAAPGVVAFAGERGGYGRLVVVSHPDGGSTYYGHLSEIAVEAGQKVGRGQKLGAVGSTGLSTGPHLHFEARDASGRPVDPGPRLAAGFSRTT
jgi:murein DD-endopeptidase MepM/ murein hydrolase activator NlpD